MNKQIARFLRNIVNVAFLVLLVSFFLVLGSDISKQMNARLLFGVLIFPLFLWVYRRQFISIKFWNLPMIVLTGFVIFQLVRYILASRTLDFEVTRLEGFSLSLKYWSFHWLVFMMSISILKTKSMSNQFASVLGWTVFCLSMNAIPALLLYGKSFYDVQGSSPSFFFPVLYFHPIISDYILGRFAHPNFTGDLLALGLFPALGVAFYGLRHMRERDKAKDMSFTKEKRARLMTSIFLKSFFSFVISAAILLLFSRGTILCFSLFLAVYLLAMCVKFPSKKQIGLTIGFLIVGLAFLGWTNNLNDLWKELQTLQAEVGQDKKEGVNMSADTNREGFRRAMSMYRDYPRWGLGTYGYKKYAVQYAGENWKKYPLARFQSLCHYAHLLAEEGNGAYLYFAFLIVYFLSMVWGLFSTRSNYKFIIGLSFMMPVLIVLTHAAFNHLMQRFSVSVLVYALMGAGIAVLRKDFEHE